MLALLGGHLERWKPKEYLTVTFAPGDANSVARWIDFYAAWVLKRSAYGALSIRLARFSVQAAGPATKR